MNNFFRTLITFFKNLQIYRLTDGAALLSYYFIFSLFPALLIVFSILTYLPINYSLFESSSWLMQHIPPSVAKFMLEFLEGTSNKSSFAVISVSSIFALWTVSSGMLATIRQINLVYRAKETRNFIQLRLLALFMSLSLGGFIFIPVLFVMIERYLFVYIPLPISSWVNLLVSLSAAKYLLLSAFIASFYAFIFYFGPNLKQKIKHVLPGSVFSSSLLIGLTKLLEYYLQNFANYNKLYGSLGVVIALLLWLYILGALLILGAEVNKLVKKIISNKRKL